NFFHSTSDEIDRKNSGTRLRICALITGSAWRCIAAPIDAGSYGSKHTHRPQPAFARDPARFGVVTTPGGMMPPATRGNVGEVDRDGIFGDASILLDGWMQTQLQDRRNLPAGLTLVLGTRIDVPWIQH